MKKPGRRERTDWFFFLLLVFAGNFWAASAAGGESFIFPEMSGWKQPEKAQVFSPETLYEYIDGAADLYLKYDFQDLKVAEYRSEKKASVTVEVYRHRTPNDSFGIYSQERLADADLVDIGAQGYWESMVLNFVKGPYYVKINGYETGEDDREVLLSFARKVAQNLEGQTSLPAILSSFPLEGKKKNSEKFIARDFLGYSFLHSGFTADYERSGKRFQVFVIEGRDRDDCGNMMEKFFKQAGNSEKKPGEGPHRLKDPHHGEVDLFWRGRYIWGTLNLEDPDLRGKYLKQFEDQSGK